MIENNLKAVDETRLSKLTVIISSDLEAQIAQVQALGQVVKEKEEAAKQAGIELDYDNFPEYTDLHNLFASVRGRLATAACAAADLPNL